MTLFEKIVSEIITEDVQVGKINDAISRSYAVKINYRSETDNADGERIIQPVAYGLTKAGKPVIRAYQPLGDTKTSVPAWKFFLVSGIQSWKPMYKQVFHAPPADNFNPYGDKTMSVVYKVAKFLTDPNKEIAKQPEPIKAKGPVKKTDITPSHITAKDNDEVKKLDKLRKQLDNPTYISDIIRNNVFGVGSKPADNSHMVANSGPIAKDMENNETKPVNNDSFETQTEKDINSRYNQMNKNEFVSKDVLDQWKKEQERRNKNKYGSNRTRTK